MSMRLHLAGLGMFAASVMAGLWQNGDPQITLGILAVLFPAALPARLPERWYPHGLRQALQIVVGLAGVAWWAMHFRDVPPDLGFAQLIAILGLALTLAGAPRDFSVLGILALILAGYGGLFPNRDVYLPALSIFAPLALFVLYETRTSTLLRRGDRTVAHSGKPCRKSWSYRTMHLALLTALFVLLLSLSPLPYGRSAGLVPVAFPATQRPRFPLRWRQWLAPQRSRDTHRDAPPATDVQADPAAAPGEHGPPATSSADAPMRASGGGGSGIGRDLLFRVQSPAKLYWLAQLYDVYDGQYWRASAELSRGHCPFDRRASVNAVAIRQVFSIEKAVSSRLYAAFHAQQIIWDAAASGAAVVHGRATGGGAPPPLSPLAPWGATIMAPDTPLPWVYECWSVVPLAPEDNLGIAPADDGQDASCPCLTLPAEVITPRLRELAQTLVRDQPTPLARALALRDHLRRGYRYSLEPPPIPPEAETADFFLFVSREGYCQHFAQALTILARLAGLPARLAVGFSPGTFNALTRTFDVHEYHAHAWAQVHVAPYGWLTLDGVPPGSLPRQTAPPLLGNLLDPFGDRWQARPPELALGPLAKPRGHAGTSTPGGGTLRPLDNALRRLHRDAAARTGRGTVDPLDLAATLWIVFRSWILGVSGNLLTAARHWGQLLWFRILHARQFLVLYYAQMRYIDWLHLLGTLVVALTVLHERHTIRRQWRQHRARRRCAALWRALEETAPEDHALIIRRCHAAAQAMLAAAELRRPRNMDMLEFAQWLLGTVPVLADDLGVVAELHARQTFGAASVSGSEAIAARECIRRLRERLLTPGGPPIADATGSARAEPRGDPAATCRIERPPEPPH